jgi:hypothetical protein
MNILLLIISFLLLIGSLVNLKKDDLNKVKLYVLFAIIFYVIALWLESN